MNADDLAGFYSEQLGRAYAAVTAATARDVHELSLSGLGRCLRAGAYALAGTPVSNTPEAAEKRAANHGRAIHDVLLPQLAETCGGARYERRVTLRAAGISLAGHFDMHDAERRCVVDVKTVGDYMHSRVTAGVVPAEHYMQIAAYATALVQEGHDIDWLVLVFVHRATGAALPVVLPYGVDDGVAVVERVAAVVRAAAEPDLATREGPGPSWSIRRSFSPCDECPWLSRCWSPVGVSDVPDAPPQAAVLADTSAEEAVAEYVRARTAAGEADDAKRFWNAVLGGVAPGVYGAWRYRRTRVGAIRITPAGQ